MQTPCCKNTISAYAGTCPVSGWTGMIVPLKTVTALAETPLQEDQSFWLCRDPDCEVVYFGSEGTLISAEELKSPPGFKSSSGAQGLVCYCFSYRGADLTSEASRERIREQIRANVRALGCACDVQNPSGKCCLGEI